MEIMKENDDLFFKKGRGAQYNSVNKFLKNHIEQDIDAHISEEEIKSQPQTQFFLENPKKIISTYNSPDLRNGFSINPYQGCEHGCIYCYARNSHEYWGYSAGIDFETKIMYKPNAAIKLEKQFQSKTWEPQIVSLSGNTDCYQPAERKFEITRSLLKIFLQYRNPVSIITKNALILRDTDILQELAKMNLIHVNISITTLNEELRRAMEPRTVTAGQKLNVINQLTKAGIPVAIMTAPIIPGLNDHEIPSIIEEAAKNGARDAGYTVVRLNGAIGEIFEDWINKSFPDKALKVIKKIKSCHGGKLNDSQWYRRMHGEGLIAEHIAQVHELAKKRWMNDNPMPAYDLSYFRRNMQMSIF